ncbi:MAG: glycosyltransferase [Prevotellaceae bacterium]|jgi:glycosyltransferase involved in cell wall biosynthesis|nr:glycosyltransferase [Prevotellaceae bacterium]
MNGTTISVVLCTYNGEEFLREQLDSIAAQTYPVHELIVQDDNSTDGTAALVESYCAQHPSLHLIYITNPQRLGFNRNFLTAFQRATGDFIAVCDQDDIWEPQKLERLVCEAGDAMLVFHNSLLFGEAGVMRKLHQRPLPARPTTLQALLTPMSYGHQLMFSRKALPVLNAFSPCELSYDYFTYALCGCMGSIRYVDEPLVRWRRYNRAATFSDKEASNNRLYGYWRALLALGNRANRERTSRYFALFTALPFVQGVPREVVTLMSRNRTVSFLKAALLCLRHKRELVADKHGLMQSLRAFFVPLFFIRDHGRYIVKL